MARCLDGNRAAGGELGGSEALKVQHPPDHMPIVGDPRIAPIILLQRHLVEIHEALVEAEQSPVVVAEITHSDHRVLVRLPRVEEECAQRLLKACLRSVLGKNCSSKSIKSWQIFKNYLKNWSNFRKISEIIRKNWSNYSKFF